MLTQTDRLTDTDEKMNKNNYGGSSKKTTMSNTITVPPDIMYLYYPHLGGATLKGSLLPASIVKTCDSNNKQQ